MDLQTVEIEGVTYAKVADGKPIYMDGDKEVAFDATGTIATIGRLNGEAKTHREGKEAAEKLLKGFDGITDTAAAIKAMETVANLDDKKLVDAGEVEKVKAEAIKAVRAEFDPVVEERDTLKKALYSEKIGGSFSRSKVIAEKLAIPADMAQAQFGGNFTIEDGKVIAKDSSGNQIYSKANPGELAGFDEAMEVLVDQYAYKDQILKGSGAQGGGARNNGNPGGGRTITRAEFDGLSAAQKSKTAAAVGAGEMSITD